MTREMKGEDRRVELVERFCHESVMTILSLTEEAEGDKYLTTMLLRLAYRACDCVAAVLIDPTSSESFLFAIASEEPEIEEKLQHDIYQESFKKLIADAPMSQAQKSAVSQKIHDQMLEGLGLGSVLMASVKAPRFPILLLFKRPTEDNGETIIPFTGYEEDFIPICLRYLSDTVDYLENIECPTAHLRSLLLTAIRVVLRTYCERELEMKIGLDLLASRFMENIKARGIQPRYRPIAELGSGEVWGHRISYSFPHNNGDMTIDHARTYASLFGDKWIVELDKLCAEVVLGEASGSTSAPIRQVLPVHHLSFCDEGFQELIKKSPGVLPGDLVIDVGEWDERVIPDRIQTTTTQWKEDVGVTLCFSSRGLRSDNPVPDGLARALESRPTLVSLTGAFLKRLREPQYQKILELLHEFGGIGIARNVDSVEILDRVCCALPIKYCLGKLVGEVSDEPLSKIESKEFHRLVPKRRLEIQRGLGSPKHD